MISLEKRKRSDMYLTAAVIFACCFAQTAHCLWLRKTERREGRREAAAAKMTEVQEGTIVFGRDLEKAAGVTSQASGGTKTPNSSAGDYAIYQADQPGWSRGQAQDARLTSAWQRMTPTLQCGRDQLRFRAVGSGASRFVIQSGNGLLLPLSQVPSTCGYNMQRNSFALVMVVPYNGCNVVQEGGSYVLLMRWHGVPVTLWCPKPSSPPPPSQPSPPSPPPRPPPPPQDPPTAGPPTTAAPTTAAPTTATSSAPVTTPETPKHPHHPALPPFYPMFSPPQPATTAASPVPPHMPSPVPPHMLPLMPPHMLQFPYVHPEYFSPPGFAERPEFFTFPHFLPVYPNYPEHTPAANSTKPPPADPHVPMYPFPFPPYIPPFPWQLPLPVPQNPQPTIAEPTTAQTTTTKPGDKPQVPQNFPTPAQNPFFPPYLFPYPPYPPYPHNPAADPEIPTQMPPAPAKRDVSAPPSIPGFNYLPFYGQFPAQFMQYHPYVPFP